MNVFIAGGTSGIGYSLALHYLSKGYHVGICGRNPAKITREHSENLQVFQTDVIDNNSISSVLQSFLVDKNGLDIFINCAGSYAEDVAGRITYEEAEEMLQTNILGTVNCFEASRKAMKNQKNGRML